MLGRPTGQALAASCFSRGETGLDMSLVAITMARQHGVGGGLVFACLPLEVGAGTAAGLRRVAGEFDAVDGKHLVADESLAIADGEHGAEDFGDDLVQRADEVGDGREVWLTIAGQGDEGELIDTGLRDETTGDEAASRMGTDLFPGSRSPFLSLIPQKTNLSLIVLIRSTSFA